MTAGFSSINSIVVLVVVIQSFFLFSLPQKLPATLAWRAKDLRAKRINHAFSSFFEIYNYDQLCLFWGMSSQKLYNCFVWWTLTGKSFLKRLDLRCIGWWPFNKHHLQIKGQPTLLSVCSWGTYEINVPKDLIYGNHYRALVFQVCRCATRMPRFLCAQKTRDFRGFRDPIS